MANEKKVVVQREFTLVRDNGSKVNYRPGTHNMPADDADHWYTRLHIEGGDEAADLGNEVDPLTGAVQIAQPIPNSGAGTGDDEEVDVDDDGIADMTVAQLRDELRGRDLAVSGSKDELLQRLRDDNAFKAGGGEVQQEGNAASEKAE